MTNAKEIIVVGSDGNCGWSTALHLSKLGHNVTIVHNMSHRDIDAEMGADTLTTSIKDRLIALKERSGLTIKVENTGSRAFGPARNQMAAVQPGTSNHFAEQRAEDNVIPFPRRSLSRAG